MILVVSQKSMVVKTKQISWFPWLVKKVWWLKPNRFHDFGGYSKKYGGYNQTIFVILVVSQKSIVVKTKQISWFRWLVKKVWLLKQNNFRDFGG